MNKEQFSDALARQGIKEVCRDQIEGEEVFFADGFVPADRVKYLEFFGLPKMGNDYPTGCYATIWYAPRRLGWCGIGVCEPLHDIAETIQGRQTKRINSLRVMAKIMLSKSKAKTH